MIKVILVPSTGSKHDIASFEAALAVARQFGAHLDILHVRIDAANIALAMATDAGSGALTAGLIEQLEQDAREREAKAEAAFRRFCNEAGLALADAPPRGGSPAPSAAWHVEIGDEPRWMAAYGLAADLIVGARGRGGDDAAGARSVLEAVLLDTGRPLLIPANAGALPANFDRIAIAWKATPQTARAVALAMPLLVRAQRIAVLTVEEGADQQPDQMERLLRHLAWHGLAAASATLPPGPEGAVATLLSAARERADLLVMGGYGHRRLREWIFGGFTQRVLADAPLPVLIAH
jgi:nucleotide-binding universal stress UspA family protein